MRELGKLSAKARARPNPERVHESLRTYLKREVPPARVWEALEAAMLGNNESARVSASRVLLDALHEPEQLEERDIRAKIQAETKAMAAEAGRKLEQLVESAVPAIVRGDDLRLLPGWVAELAGRLDAETQAKIAELKANREQLEAEGEKVRTQLSEFVTT